MKAKKYTYQNNRNGGREMVKRDEAGYYINSDCGNGFMGWIDVTLEEMKQCLRHTNAPQEIVDEIIGK